jgi:hypothetical protein
MLTAIIDRIDGNQARVLIGDEGVAVLIGLQHLPPHSHEGMVMRLKFTADAASTAAREGKSRYGRE